MEKTSMPSHISFVEPLAPEWPSWRPIFAGDDACTKSTTLAQAACFMAAATAAALAPTPATAQAKEQFFPVLVYRTGAYAPNGVPFANGYVDYLKLVNAQGGINGVKVSFEECETGYATDKGVECYERLKGKHGGATLFQPLSTGITFALTGKAPRDLGEHKKISI